MKETDFKWTADLVKDFCEYAGLRIGKKEDIREQLNYLIEDFKASHTTEVKGVDWQVIAYSKKDNPDCITTLRSNGRWLNKDQDGGDGNYGQPSEVLWMIYSVKRLSDGEVFSVRDEVETNSGRGRHTITEFKLFDGDVMCVGMKGFPVYYEFLSRISKPLQRTPLFDAEKINARIAQIKEMEESFNAAREINGDKIAIALGAPFLKFKDFNEYLDWKSKQRLNEQ